MKAAMVYFLDCEQIFVCTVRYFLLGYFLYIGTKWLIYSSVREHI